VHGGRTGAPNVTLADLSSQDPLPDSMADPGGSEFVYTPQGRPVVPGSPRLHFRPRLVASTAST